MKAGNTGGTAWWASAATGFPFFRESLQKKNSVIHPDVIIGSRGEVSERARFGPSFYGGWVVLNLTPGHMSTVFPWLLGANASGTTYALAETLQNMSVLVDKVTGVHEFYDGYINRAVIHGKQNGPGGPPNWITVALQMMFKSYSAPGVTAYPTLTLGVTGEYAPLIFEDSVLTLAGTATEAKEFTIDINNYIQPRWINSLTPSTLCPSRRTVTMNTVHPYDTTPAALYNLAITGIAGTNTLAITNGSVSMTATFGTLQEPVVTPTIQGKKEINLQLEMSARSIGATPAISWAIDSTP